MHQMIFVPNNNNNNNNNNNHNNDNTRGDNSSPNGHFPITFICSILLGTLFLAYSFLTTRRILSRSKRATTTPDLTTTNEETLTLLQKRNAQILTLQTEIQTLTTRLAALTTTPPTPPTPSRNRQQQQRRYNAYVTIVHDDESPHHHPQRTRLLRGVSNRTTEILNSFQQFEDDDTTDPLAQRIITMFQDPASNMPYLNSDAFAADILKINAKVRPILREEPRCIFLQSPCYVFGDLHGNLEDLHFFSDNVWRLGMTLTAGNFLFLGDYVDRGLNSLEVIVYLLAMKLMLPRKVFLLRGNHETRDVNGWEEHYGERSFASQCRNRFGDALGRRVWESTNRVFDALPLAAVIDRDIFCVHGGIPRPVSFSDDDGVVSSSSRLNDILKVPKVAGINPPYKHETEASRRIASDCIWADPASEEQERSDVDPVTGFGTSLRGGGAICFGHKAVTDFLVQHGLSYIMRAHSAHAEGVAVSKGARVFTIFSTSKDHNQGSEAVAGCILVDSKKIQVINRSPAYQNQYVHRRDSESIGMLSEKEIEQRIKLGLITLEDECEEEDSWEDFEESDDYEEDDDENYDSEDEDDDDDNCHEVEWIDEPHPPCSSLITIESSNGILSKNTSIPEQPLPWSNYSSSPNSSCFELMSTIPTRRRSRLSSLDKIKENEVMQEEEKKKDGR